MCVCVAWGDDVGECICNTWNNAGFKIKNCEIVARPTLPGHSTVGAEAVTSITVNIV